MERGSVLLIAHHPVLDRDGERVAGDRLGLNHPPRAILDGLSDERIEVEVAQVATDIPASSPSRETVTHIGCDVLVATRNP
jgi:hypothetical protein